MDAWKILLETAIHAPSPHNVQPWRVRIRNEEEATLYIDSRRTLPKEDTTGSFILLTMGMFIEALSILAAGQRLRLEHEPLHEPSWFLPAMLQATEQTFLPFARMKLKPGDVTEPEYDPALFHERRTSRMSCV